jgi:hypothetical protein
MSGIVKRTVFADQEKGYWRFHDYCMVNTSLGVMVEFDSPFQRRGTITEPTQIFNPNDQAVKVNEIMSMSLDRRPDFMWNGDQTILLHENWNYNEEY